MAHEKKCSIRSRDMQKNDAPKYAQFWKQFGRVLKEGSAHDFDNKDKLVQLYLFESSGDPES